MRITKLMLTLALLLGLTHIALAKENRMYRIEMIIFEMQDKNSITGSYDPGAPNTANSVTLSNDPAAEFILLTDKQLSLNSAKQRIASRYPIILHKGWRQTISDKEHSQKVHIEGAKNEHQVDGTVRVSMGRSLNLDADLILRKSGAAHRLKETSRLRIDEITYIDHPNYGLLVMVVPEKIQATEKPAIIEKAVQEVKAKAAQVEVEDNDKPILPKDRKALLQKASS